MTSLEVLFPYFTKKKIPCQIHSTTKCFILLFLTSKALSKSSLHGALKRSSFFVGWPASTVSWWQDGQLIDHSYEEIIPGKSRNTMKVESLQRHHRHTEFTCSGNNNNRSQALSRAVILDLYCKFFSKILRFFKD